jgi:exonuclease III
MIKIAFSRNEIELFKPDIPLIADLSQNIKVITYNINVLPFSRKGKNYSVLVEYLKPFDVVFIQEAFINPVNGNDLAQKLLRKGFDVLVPPSPNFLNKQWSDSGLLTAVKTSKLRIKEFGFQEYKNKSSIDSLSQKGVLWCKTNEGHLLCNTHAQAGYVNMWPNDGLHEEVRTLQLRETIDFIPSFEQKVIFGGDFNFRSEEEIDIIKSRFKYFNINSLDAIFSTNTILTDPEFNNPFDSDHYSVETTIVK